MFTAKQREARNEDKVFSQLSHGQLYQVMDWTGCTLTFPMMWSSEGFGSFVDGFNNSYGFDMIFPVMKNGKPVKMGVLNCE